MHPAPDHSPATAAGEHAALIVALDAGDLAGRERDDAATLAATCAGCASLLEDLAVLRAATAALVVTPRSRDFRLTEADAARLRPSTWRSLVRWLAAPRSSVRPLAGGLAALGIAGLLLTTTPGFFGGAATSLSTTGAPVVAPGGAEGAGGGPAGNAVPGAASAAPSAASSVEARATGAAPIEPGASPASAAGPVLGTPGTTPGLAALPAPSPATVAGPAPTPIPDAGTVTGPAAAATAATGPSGFSTDVGAPTDSTKAAPPEASLAGRNAVPAAPSEPTPADRTLPLLLSLALLVAGLGLLVANRVLRGRAGS